MLQKRHSAYPRHANLVKQTVNARFKAIIADIASRWKAGKVWLNLWESITMFSNIFISMVKVGELSGNLDKSLNI